MFKLISIDLDDTLLDCNQEISEENLKAINYAKSKGCIICVNTGRNFPSCINFCEEIKADFVIYLHGCFVYDLKNKKYVKNKIISYLHFFIFYTLPFEIISNKARGLKKLCKYLSIKLKNTVSIGDSSSDLSMIKKSGLGICVANSSWYVRSRSDYVTIHGCNSSAVAEAIYYALDEIK